jgi:hypothetical protein
MKSSLNYSRSFFRRRKSLPAWVRALIPTFLIIVLVGFRAQSQTPRISWAEQLTGSANAFLSAMNAAMDQQGNVIFTGWFYTPTLTFGSQTLTNSSLSLNVNGGINAENGFVAKYSHSGDLLWVRHIGGSLRDGVEGCAADAAGNVFVTGWILSSNAWFGTNLIVNAGGNSALFLCKFDPQGNLLWVQQVAGNAGGNTVGLDRNGNVHLAGTFSSGSLIFGTNVLINPYYDPETNAYPFGDFVAEFTADGDAVWARAVSFSSDDNGRSFAADALGNSYISDSFSAVANFGSMALTNSSASGATLFLAKYDPSGNLAWVEPVGVSSQGIPSEGLAVGPQGDTHILGGYSDAMVGTNTLPIADGGFAAENAFVAKFDSDGQLIWVDPIVVNTPWGFWGANLAVDPMDNCWAIGSAAGPSVGFGSVTVTNSDASTNDRHCFIAKFHPSGNLLWARTVNSPGVSTYAVGVLDSTQDLFLYGVANGTNALNLAGIVINGPTDGTNYFFAARIDGPTLSAQSVAGQIVISWPTNAAGLNLESTADLSSGNWSPVTNAPAIDGDQYSVTNNIGAGSQFYRLRNF